MSKFLATAEIVSALIKAGAYPDIPEKIREVFTVFSDLEKPQAKPQDYISGDFLICALDGRKVKNLRKYVERRGYNWFVYLEKYGLPRDFPDVSPSYRIVRSRIARETNLGGKK